MVKDLISIIVPVYNVEDYIEKCVESLLNQTYKNIEILLVNDGSTDRSLNLCESLKKKDNRVKVYSKENGGLSSARNYGIEQSVGEYLTFVDSDDYVESEFVQMMYDSLLSTQSDISVCGYDMVYENSNKVVSINNGIDIKIYDRISALKSMFIVNDIGMIFCNKLFKSELFQNVTFPIGKHFEDINTLYKIIDKSEKIVYHPIVLYHYLQRFNSINGKNFKSEKFSKSIYDLYYANMEVYNFIKNNYYSIVYDILPGCINYNLRVVNQLVRFKINNDEIFNSTKLMIKDNWKVLRKKISFKRKIQYFLFIRCNCLYKFMIRYIVMVRK